MLRITRVAEDTSQVTLRLEGRIVVPWTSTLDHECTLRLEQDKQVLLDFADVTFVDERGARMIANLQADGVRIINASQMISDWLRGFEKR